MSAHVGETNKISEKEYILRAGAFEQEGSSVDEYAVLIEGLRTYYDSYELYFMLGLYYRYRNPDQAYLCFENALHYCQEPEDEKTILAAIEGIRDRARVRNTSIVVVSYNDLELMRECIHAIRRTLPEGSYEVIVVDNSSTDEEVLSFLRQQADDDDDFILIENEDNSGFSIGCNLGLSEADPENDVFFLNNDAILMPNSLFWLRMGLYSDSRNGAAGAVSNSASCQEVSIESIEPYIRAAHMDNTRPITGIRIEDSILGKAMNSGSNPDFASSSEIGEDTDNSEEKRDHRWWRTISLDSALEASKNYAKDHNVPMWNPYEVRCRLTGFAVLLKRKAVDNLLRSGDISGKNVDNLHDSKNNGGLLAEGFSYKLFDERFSPAYFEDDDLGIRLGLLGYRQILCHNSFIFHNGGAGFTDKSDEIEDARGKFKEKWGFDIWNYSLPEDEKITALLDAIKEIEINKSASANSESDETREDSAGNVGPQKVQGISSVEMTEADIKPYNKYYRILDLSAGLGATMSAIKYMIPSSFVAGVTSVDVFAGLSKYMGDDIISGDPELVTFPWPEHSFDIILAGEVIAGADDPERLVRKLNLYLTEKGRVI